VRLTVARLSFAPTRLEANEFPLDVRYAFIRNWQHSDGTFTVTPREFRMTVHFQPSSDVMPDGAAIKEASKLLD